jgi:DNA-binding transcriptional ArsR family regulator
MIEEPDISRLARTIGDMTRIRMLTLLMEGRALTAKELAYGSGVEPATATAHLNRLRDDGFVGSTAQGRHRYFQLASPEVARLIEALMVVAPTLKPNCAHHDHPIRRARFCYDHLAGELGTQLTEFLLAGDLLLKQEKAFVPSREGEAWFRSFGVDLQALRRTRRELAYRCLDWSERKDHLAGALGAAMAQRMIVLGWITRTKDSRVVAISTGGRRALARRFGISCNGGKTAPPSECER